MNTLNRLKSIVYSAGNVLIYTKPKCPADALNCAYDVSAYVFHYLIEHTHMQMSYYKNAIYNINF